MNNHTLDITDQWQSVETYSALTKISGISLGEWTTGLEYNMYFNNKLAPMDDVNFRRAMASLVDYDTIVKNIFPDSVKSTGPVSAGVAGHADTKTLSYDINKAKQYLAASKYANTYKNYPVEIVCNSDVSDLEKIALLVQQATSQIGITVKITKAPWSSLTDRMGSVSSSPQITIINSAPAYNDAGSYLSDRYSSSMAGTWEQGEWLQNTQLDGMLADAIGTADQTQRFSKYADIQNYIVDNLYPTAYLCDLTERVAYQSSYLTWPAIAKKDGKFASFPMGYEFIFADMQLKVSKK
jgi:peptide/nickel transport system substrate-binding protein